MKGVIIDYMRLLRLPALIGLAMTPVVGALSVGYTSIAAILALLFIGGVSKIYGFVLNDYYDVEVDTACPDLSLRPLVKGSVTRRQALAVILACFFIAYLAFFLFFYRNPPYFYAALVCIVLADVLSFVYNKYGKRLIGSDFLDIMRDMAPESLAHIEAITGIKGTAQGDGAD